MSDLSAAAVKVVNRRDQAFGVQLIPADLSIAIEDLRVAVHADAERRRGFVEAARRQAEDAFGATVPTIPTEPLDECPEARRLTLAQQRLWMAFRLFCAAITGKADVIANTPPLLRVWCWEQANGFLSDADQRPTRPSMSEACGSETADVLPGVVG